MGKPTWIFCGGMARSGSTLQFQIASELVERLRVGRRITGYTGLRFKHALAEHGQAEGLLVFKSHHLTPTAALEMGTNGGHVLTSHRDIRDVTASWMVKRRKTFRYVWKRGLLATWTRRFDEWAAIPGAYVARYGQARDDVAGEARRIATTLGLTLPPDLPGEIASFLALDRQRERMAAVPPQAFGGRDPHSLLHANHIASGSDGMYRHVLAAAEVRAVERQRAAWMARMGYPLDSPRLSPRQWWYRCRLGRPGFSWERPEVPFRDGMESSPDALGN